MNLRWWGKRWFFVKANLARVTVVVVCEAIEVGVVTGTWNGPRRVSARAGQCDDPILVLRSSNRLAPSTPPFVFRTVVETVRFGLATITSSTAVLDLESRCRSTCLVECSVCVAHWWLENHGVLWSS